MGRPDLVVGTLESLIKQVQLPVEWEILLVGVNARNAARAFSRLPIRSVELVRKENPAVTRNRGAEQALGEWLLFIDDDIELQASYFQDLIAITESDRSIVAGRLPSKFATIGSRLVDYANFWSQQIDKRGTRDWFYSAALAVRASVYREVGGFDPGFAIGEDVDFTGKIRRAGYRLHYEPSLVAFHNHGRTSLRRAFAYFLENGRGARFFTRHAYLTRCFNIQSAVYRAYQDYRTNESLNSRGVKGFRFYSAGIFTAYLVFQFSIEYHYQRMLLDERKYRTFPVSSFGDRWAAKAFASFEDGRHFHGIACYGVSLLASLFEPVRR